MSRNRWIVMALAVVLVLAGTWLVFGGGGPLRNAAAPTPAPTLPPVEAPDEISAEARVVPLRHADLGAPSGATVASIEVAEGDEVERGALLMRLESGTAAAAVLQAEADLAAAQAQLRQLEAGPSEEALAAARAAVRRAEAQAAASSGGVSAAQAGLERVAAGASAEQVAIAERQVEEAKNALWGASATRDALCGRVEEEVYGVDPIDCDAAKAAALQAEEAVRIAELRLQDLRAGASAADRSAAAAGVQQARSQLAGAGASVDEARAQLAALEAGPDDEERAAARARVDQAIAAIELARLRMDETQLRAPFAGTVAAVEVEVGEQVTPGVPVLRLADQSEWRIETEDLTEIQVVEIEEGADVTITFDALPNVELPGRVERIRPLGEDRLGDVVYRAVIEPLQTDPRLRWNMTAVVTIAAGE
jgi:HlyD family secretion protein